VRIICHRSFSSRSLSLELGVNHGALIGGEMCKSFFVYLFNCLRRSGPEEVTVTLNGYFILGASSTGATNISGGATIFFVGVGSKKSVKESHGINVEFLSEILPNVYSVTGEDFFSETAS
jgi:hypothetical protein